MATGKKKRLRIGFSTGTAMTAAARAALRALLTGSAPRTVAVRLPVGYYLAVDVSEVQIESASRARASVIKDGGDDPDATDKAEIRVTCTLPASRERATTGRAAEGPVIRLAGGRGVGCVTKAGLPVKIGEPAVNPGPRAMLEENLREELLRQRPAATSAQGLPGETPALPPGAVFLPLGRIEGRPDLDGLEILVEVDVPEGETIARHTLNPRLGILGGISILGVTGLVKPFSHEAYEETIQAALSVALANRCDRVVLSTGGRSERFAQKALPDLREECFIQIADFFAFAVRECARNNVRALVHSVFFGKALKMARGHEYTHAHRVPLDLELLSRLAIDAGHGESLSREIASANTARHAFEIIRLHGADDLFRAVAERAAAQSFRFGTERMPVRLLLFDYDGELISDVETP